MPFRQRVIQFDRFLRRFLGPQNASGSRRVAVEHLDVVGVRDSREGFGIRRIYLRRLIKKRQPFLQTLFSFCPLCVVAMPIITILVLVKLMAKPNSSTPAQMSPDPEPESPSENS